MILPRNGQIAVIDDQTEEEALPLLKALFKDGFSALYFSGQPAELPEEPLKNIRVVFLDLELTPGTDVQTKAAATANILSRVIDISTTSFYFLIIWATHDELIKPFWRYIETNPNYKCAFLTVSLNKSECSAKDYDISFIRDEIKKKLEGNDGFMFLVNWENVINKSANDSIRELLSLLKNDGDINKKLLRIIKNLAIAYAGNHINDATGQVVKNAMLAFNSIYKDSLESNTIDVSDDGFDFNGVGEIQDKNIKAAINSKLLLCNNSLNPKPGNVYLETRNGLHNDICSDLICNDRYIEEVVANSQLISCEVSPFCDYAQKKWRVGRLVFGIFIDHSYYKRIKQADCLYKTPLLKYDDKIGHFIFDMRRIESKKLGRWRKEIISAMRYDLVIDLQHKIGGHCSRPGMFSL